MSREVRSECPINLSLELFGDRWTLLIVRDIAFGGVRYFNEMINNQEGVSSSVLTDRLNTLIDAGLLTRSADPGHRQKVRYSLTEAAIQLVPILTQLTVWGLEFLPADPHTRANALIAGGPPMMQRFLDDLREDHLGPDARHAPSPEGPRVSEQLEAAYAAG